MIGPSGRPIVLAIDDVTMTGEARRSASSAAGRLGFDETERGRVSIVATEAATNLSKHGGGGEILIQGMESGASASIDILALDRGPGMPDVGRCRADGYSTAGSPGTGMGAMARLSAVFDVYSAPGSGTVALARLRGGPAAARPPASTLEVGAVNLPLAGEEVCGDSWGIEEIDGRIVILVVDGLGHGPQAALAAREVLRAFSETSALAPAEIIRAAHEAARATRGAALAVARIDPGAGEVRFAGVGNIAGAILGPAPGRSLSMVSHNGIVGHAIRKIQEFAYPWADGSLIVMHSDGVATQWHLERYPGLVERHPGVVAGVLCRDFRRGRDDATVVVAREGSASRR